MAQAFVRETVGKTLHDMQSKQREFTNHQGENDGDYEEEGDFEAVTDDVAEQDWE